jgi:polar amino acid transport system substrate-binding protein
MKRLYVAIAITTAALLSGCSSTTSTSAAPTSSATPAVAPPAITQTGQLTICSDISSPPIEYFDAANKPQGSDIEIGNAIGAKLNLKVIWRQTSFSSIIPTLQAGHCDAIMSQLFIKPARLLVVDMVPYMYSGESIVTTIANPKHITGLDESLCGLRVSTVPSTTAQADVADQSAKCVAAKKPAISILTFTADTDALQQLALGRSDAYATTSETSAYYMTKQPNTYAFAGSQFGKIQAGIAVQKGNAPLLAAITKALGEIKADGTYDGILKKYGLSIDSL